MTHRKRPHLTATVAAETLVLANKAMDEMDLPLGHALDVIIREWSSSKEIEPVNSTPESLDLKVLQNTLDSLANDVRYTFRTIDVLRDQISYMEYCLQELMPNYGEEE